MYSMLIELIVMCVSKRHGNMEHIEQVLDRTRLIVMCVSKRHGNMEHIQQVLDHTRL